MHSGRLVTVFSARNYCGSVSNDGALILFSTDEVITQLLLLASLSARSGWTSSGKTKAAAA